MIDRQSKEFKEKRKQVSREWYKNNKERKLIYMKKYWSNPQNLKKSIERTARWRKEHREEYNDYMKNYYRKKLNVKNPYIKGDENA